MAPMSMPCISIQLVRAQEAPGDQQFGNEFEDVDTAATPAIRVPVVTPTAYDTITGKLSVTDGADISLVCPGGQNYIDASEVAFQIKPGNSNVAGNKFINIGPGQTVDIGGAGRIESCIAVDRVERRMIRLRETINLGCHSKDDIHLTKYIYYILTFILKSRQDSLIDRGITLDAGDASVFDRVEEMAGENIFSRYISVSCITEFDWDQASVNLIDCFDLTVKTPTPDADSTTAANYNPDE